MTGRGSGTGTFSFHERHRGSTSVMVARMPEDHREVRIAFRNYGATLVPTLTMSNGEAEMLWAALSSMAKDLKWEDYESTNE